MTRTREALVLMLVFLGTQTTFCARQESSPQTAEQRVETGKKAGQTELDTLKMHDEAVNAEKRPGQAEKDTLKTEQAPVKADKKVAKEQKKAAKKSVEMQMQAVEPENRDNIERYREPK